MTVLEGAAMRTECGSSTSLATDHCNAAAVDLLDEFWFFKNALVLSQAPKCADDAGVYSKENGKEQAVVRCPNRVRDESSPPLQRMPTLPPRLQRMHTVQEAITSLKSCNLKLRYSLSSLDNYQSSSSSKSAARDKPPRYIKLERSERYLAIQHYIAKEAYYRKIFKEKKWRSHSDLEYIEVQGFKDLGFVFDKEELNASLARVIPFLNDKKTENGENIARSPYLSEAWRAQKSAPVMFRRVDKRSAEDMKEQLKFWARAVACNARQVL